MALQEKAWKERRGSFINGVALLQRRLFVSNTAQRRRCMRPVLLHGHVLNALSPPSELPGKQSYRNEAKFWFGTD